MAQKIKPSLSLFSLIITIIGYLSAFFILIITADSGMAAIGPAFIALGIYFITSVIGSLAALLSISSQKAKKSNKAAFTTLVIILAIFIFLKSNC